MTSEAKRPYDAIVFDLGGVLVELGGVTRMLELLDNRISVDDLWTRWLTSKSVRDFETGFIDADQFALALLAEFELGISAEQLIQEFTAWPKGIFPGTIELLQSLAEHYTIACLTNTNTLHWPRISDEMGLKPYFSHQFASHLIGMLKPDLAVFQHVVEQLGYAPERILFLDDNRLNVEGALAVGMSAYRVHGLDEVIAQLTTLGVLPNNS